jgi:hypothetical protein
MVFLLFDSNEFRTVTGGRRGSTLTGKYCFSKTRADWGNSVCRE